MIVALTTDQATSLLTQLYGAVLGRAPDAASAPALIAELAAGVDPATIRSQLAFGSSEATAAVAAAYQTVLGRAPDTAGSAALLASLAGGSLTLAGVRAALASTQEASNAVGSLYQQVLGRSAASQSLTASQAQLGTGLTLAGLRQQLATSPEAAATVNVLYQQALGRPVDPAGLAQYVAGLGSTVSVVDIRAQLSASPEAQSRLTASYELNFGLAPASSTLATLTTELALGRNFVDTAQVTANFVSRQDAFFIYNYGYPVPAQYSNNGAAQFVPVYQNASPLQIGAAFSTVAIPTTGAAASGGDTITVNLRTVGSAPVSFTATVDGRAVGGAMVTAGPPSNPFATATQDQVTFTGNFGAGLHDLHIQVVGDPAANALVIPGTATFDGNQFLLGSITTGATGAADIFPHAGPQSPIAYGPLP